MRLGISPPLTRFSATNPPTAKAAARAAGVAVGVDPALFMFPAVLAASVGFMLPVATAPNAIAYGSGAVDARIMLREGAVLDLIGVIVLCAVCYVAFG